jgi:hypothetical protein
MKIDLNEIWDFITLNPSPKGNGKKYRWSYKLVAGDISYDGLTSGDILRLKHDDYYDTELLPTLFTFREILWQPNVYTQPSLCLPQLNILKVYCEEYLTQHSDEPAPTQQLYLHLLKGLGQFCQDTLDSIAKQNGDIRIASILGKLRIKAFPVIQFFLFHPMNRKDYQSDALNRLNYAVKIMLTQYNSKFDELQKPYWEVTPALLEAEKTKQASSKSDPKPQKPLTDK